MRIARYVRTRDPLSQAITLAEYGRQASTLTRLLTDRHAGDEDVVHAAFAANLQH